MKIIAYTALRYGADYLGSAIRSVIDSIDEYHVLYALEPSHGHWTDAPCPETRDELHAIAEIAAGNKLRWHEDRWHHEGLQRDSIYQYAPDADVILVLDADEIWPEHINFWAVGQFSERNIRFPMVHFWRSFHKAFLHDPAYPVRIILPKNAGGDWTATNNPPIAHFGYAQRPAIVEYKWKIHGHLNEYRRDCNWFQDVYLSNRQTDCHPVGSEYWNAEDVNPADYLPAFMLNHPFANMEVIE